MLTTSGASGQDQGLALVPDQVLQPGARRRAMAPEPMPLDTGGWGQGANLVEAMAEYRLARRKLIEAIGCRAETMRDPLAEFSEALVAALTGDTLATSPVQKGWDLKSTYGITTQVRYVANPMGKWVNGHVIDFRSSDCDRYALVMFEDLVPMDVLVFDRMGLGAVCARLGKRHLNQDVTLQITPANVAQIKSERAVFEAEPYLVRIFP